MEYANNQKYKTIDANDIARFPWADVVERRVGKWKQGYCSECGYNWGKDAPIANVPNFCPNCGARMKTADNERDYERAIEQMQHDMLYEKTYNSEDGSM